MEQNMIKYRKFCFIYIFITGASVSEESDPAGGTGAEKTRLPMAFPVSPARACAGLKADKI